MFIHELYPGGPSGVVVEGEWLDVLQERGPTGLTLVRKNLQSVFNDSCRFTFLKNCEPYNVAFWPQVPGDPSCTTYCVIDKAGKYE